MQLDYSRNLSYNRNGIDIISVTFVAIILRDLKRILRIRLQSPVFSFRFNKSQILVKMSNSRVMPWISTSLQENARNWMKRNEQEVNPCFTTHLL